MGQYPYVDDNPQQIDVPPGDTSVVLQNLESFAMYRVQMTGFTIKGEGPPGVIFGGERSLFNVVMMMVTTTTMVMVMMMMMMMRDDDDDDADGGDDDDEDDDDDDGDDDDTYEEWGGGGGGEGGGGE